MEETTLYNGPEVSIQTIYEKELDIQSKLPFRSRLSFLTIIDYWKSQLESPFEAERMLAQTLIDKLADAPEFYEPIDDLSILEKHQDIVDIFLSGLIPVSRRDSQLAVVTNPFNPNGFYKTPGFQALYNQKKSGLLISKEPEVMKSFLVIKPSVEILNVYYGQDIEMDYPTIFTIQSKENGLEKHYKSELDLSFLDVKAVKPPKKLSPSQINELLHNVNNLDLWQEYIPPENFEFHGVVVMNLVDITDEEALSRLKYILLEKDAIVNEDRMQDIQQQLRTIFRIPDLKVGVTAVDCSNRSSTLYPNRLKNSFLSDSSLNLLDREFQGSVYCRMCNTGQQVLIENLDALEYKTTLEEELLAKGIKNVLVSPLKDSEGKIVGVLEIGSPNICEINSVAALRLEEILPLFTIAVERKREEVQNQIEAVIREQYTAVHPTVAWRFTQTAAKLIEDRDANGVNAKIDPIIFEDVYPLYGQMDIVGSSTYRNDAIQADLLHNLEEADRMTKLGYELLRYPLLDYLCLRIKESILSIRTGIDSSAEGRILEFLYSEVHPIFKQIMHKDSSLEKKINTYFDELDTELGIIYQQRKDYEESVMRINDLLSACIDRHQVQSQNMFPHYFEKYKTDGVEYNIYVGQSLLQNEQFSDIHLQNLRLWQLLSMCEITRKVENIQSNLPVALTTAQLILVHDTPLTIRFRMDEKQFDVDGAYNVRYEILKKRVDKALIEGTNERLTVSGKIAIVYTQDKEEREYDSYLSYLVEKGEIEPEIEKVKLAPVQGVSGLRALRVTVRPKGHQLLDELCEI